MVKHTNLDFDYDLFLQEYHRIKQNEKDYARGGKSVHFWRVIRLEDLKSELVKSYVKDFKNKYNIPGKVDGRFYRLKANSTLPMHIDSGTKCSINFLLNGYGAPVLFESGEYTYKQALLNTSIMHSVINVDKDRILFKISIFELDFNQVSSLLSK